MKLAALYCVKNEEEFLPLSVASVSPFVDEVVIINNRSTDRTMELAKSIPHHKVKLVDIDSDFDEKCEYNMRNESLKHVSDDIDWLVVLDADQLLSDGWRNEIATMLEKPTAQAVGIRYDHLVGSYNHMDLGLYNKQANQKADPVWIFFKRTPHLQCRPAAEVCNWAKPQHHASFERSCTGGLSKHTSVGLFHYGFAKRNMMEMSLYRIHRGDYGHEDSIKAEKSKELLESGNPFKFVGPVKEVGYLPKQVPSVIRPMLGKYKLELDEQGHILKRTIAATGELAQ